MALNNVNGKSAADKKAFVMANTSYMHTKNYADMQFVIRLVTEIAKKNGYTDEQIKKIRESK